MPSYLVRKTETYHLLVDAASAEEAENRAAEEPNYEWEQSDGPTFEVEIVENDGR